MIKTLFTKTHSLFFSDNAMHMRTQYMKAGSTVFVGFLIANVINYVFTLVMGRMLLPESFGVLTALLGLLAIVSVPANAVVTFVAQKMSYYRACKQYDVIQKLFRILRSYTMRAGIVFWIVFVVLIPFIADYLGGVSYYILGIFSFLIPVLLFSAVSIGILQGFEDFYSFVAQNIIGTLIKFVLAVVLVWIGWSVGGVMLAVLCSMIASYYYAFIRARVYTDSFALEASSEDTEPKEDVTQGIIIILITTALLTVLANVDVVLARHFLEPYIAGQYAALSTTGKILLYGLGAFITVLVPLASSAYSRKCKTQHAFLGIAFLVITAISFAAIVIFSLFSEHVVQLLFGQQYMFMHEYLGVFGIAMYFVAIVMLLAHYFIAAQKTKFVYVLLTGVILQIILFYIYQQSIETIVNAFVVSSGILAGGMIVYYFLHEHIKKCTLYVRRSLELDIQFLQISMSFWKKLHFIMKKYYTLMSNAVFGFQSERSFTSVFGKKYFYDDIFGLAFLQSVYVDHANLAQHINHDGVIIDIGANIGQFHFFCKQYLQAKKVYSFEPVAQSFHVLKKNTDDPIFRNAVALEDEVNIYVPECTSLMASVFSLADDDRQEVVKGIRIDNLPEIQNEPVIDLLKVDTEGSEFTALQTAQNTLKKTRFILAELSIGRDSDASFLDVIRFLRDMTPSFRICSIGRIYSDHTGDLALDVLFENTREHFE